MFARNTVRGLAVAAVLAASAASGAQAQQLPPARQLVDKYVEAIGGRFFLDSPRGAGTTLRAELPLSSPGRSASGSPPGARRRSALRPAVR